MEILKKVKAQLTGADPGGFPQAGKNEIYCIPVHLILPNPNQPRRLFSHDTIKELADSVRQYGVIQPITVRRKKDGTYEVISGERRLRAACLAGLLKIPAIVTDMEDEDSAIVSLMENIQRESLGFLEEAAAFKKILSETEITQEELASRIGKTQSYIANKIRLLKLPVSVREIIRDFCLTERHAREILRLQGEETQLKAVRRAADLNLGVKETGEMVDRIIKRGDRECSRTGVLRSISDVRVFYRTITKAVNLMNERGVEASAKKEETDSYYEYVIRVAK